LFKLPPIHPYDAMTHLPRILFLSLLVAFSCGSCGKDPKLVAKRMKQESEITRLKGEIALIEEKLKHLPPDVSVELEAAKKEAEEQTAEVARLEAEVSVLQARKRSLQDEFDTYRVKHQVK
jgi:chromosome segregation ATPase